MTTLNCYTAITMEGSGGEGMYGEVTVANETTIRWESGDFVDVYSGSFYYDSLGYVYGTLYSVTSYVGGDIISSVTNINKSIEDVLYYASFNSTSYLYEFIFSGNDLINGSAWADRLYGYDGNDKLNGNGGNDKLVADDGNDTVRGGDGNDALYGDDGQDKLYGDAGKDTLYGNNDADMIWGGQNGDKLFGHEGDDKIFGEGGTDTLSGGLGADRFIFASIADIGKGASADIIKDHDGKNDKINLHDIDANTQKSGDQAFTFIANAAFSGKAGELRYANGAVFGDVNGDGTTDFQIKITNSVALDAGDFIL